MGRRRSRSRSPRKPAKPRGAAFWRRAVAEWRESGESRTEFCTRHGLNPNTLSWWKWRLSSGAFADESTDGIEEEDAPRFLPVQVLPELLGRAPGGGVEIHLASERRIRVTADFDPELLAKVVATLEQLP